MTVDQLKAFLAELQQNKELLRSIEKTATANEVVQVANEFGFKFSGDELKAISQNNIPGVKLKQQETFPSYSFCKRWMGVGKIIRKKTTMERRLDDWIL